MKETFQNHLKMIFPEPQASLAIGMLLGKEGSLDRTLYAWFQKSGTAHILVLSGYNITIVGIFFMSILGYFLPQTLAWIGSIAGIIAFTAMTGAEAPAVRAALMALIGLLAYKTGRFSAAFFALWWSAFFMVFYNPMVLRWDRGFQLSILATLGLLVAAPPLLEKLKFLPSAYGVRESIASTLAAQMFVLPLFFSWGNDVSILSPIANIFIVGAVPYIMLFSFVGGLVSFVSIAIAQSIASVAYLLISFQIMVARTITNFPVGNIFFSGLPEAMIGLVYGALFIWSARFYWNNV